MNRRLLIATLSLGLLAPTGAWAQSYAEQIVQQLRDQGYNGIAVNNTWLGRTRIVASSGDGNREIIIDPRTGEILRDLYTGRSGGPRIVDDRPRDGNSGPSNDSDSDDDDDADDEDDDGDEDDEDEDEGDNSGHGSGGSDNDGDSDDSDDDD